ncbi:MAG TPA: hypothetical protein VKN36_13395 [Eudoraea sp.]|nr:hypothetical protein [Eudoraea sp.]
MKRFPLVCSVLIITQVYGQKNSENDLPYHKIPEAPEHYNAGTVVSRLIDGLGFRYYWATEGLTEKDLAYKPSDTNRTIEETTDHLYNLSRVIYNSALKDINDGTVPRDTTLTFKEKREATLLQLKTASDIFRSVTDLEEHKVVFKNKNGTVEYPFWNQINGPISDALWHCGQVVAMRRASGNPIDPEVSVFQGVRRGSD